MVFDYWTAETPDGLIRWENSDPWVFGPSRAAIALQGVLEAYRGDITVAPLGPFLKTTPEDPYVVAILIKRIWPTAKFSSDAPNPDDLIPSGVEGYVN